MSVSTRKMSWCFLSIQQFKFHAKYQPQIGHAFIYLRFMSFPIGPGATTESVFCVLIWQHSNCICQYRAIYTTRSMPCNSTFILKPAFMLGMNWFQIAVKHCNESCLHVACVKRCRMNKNKSGRFCSTINKCVLVNFHSYTQALLIIITNEFWQSIFVRNKYLIFSIGAYGYHITIDPARRCFT